MDKSIIIAGLDYWRIEGQKALGYLAPQIMRAITFNPEEPAESIGKKFQVCLREFYMEFRKAGRLSMYNQLLSKALEAGYEKAGARRGAGVDEFLKYVIERDRLIGLEAGGRKTSETEFIYWIKDMFLPLCMRNEIYSEEYEKISTNGYLRAKINYFLPDPDGWEAEMTASPFDSDRTQWRIYRKQEHATVLPRKPLMEAITA